MRDFRIIDALDATASGPVRRRDRKPVHLRQGDADAACGPYCTFIALLVVGLVADRDHLGPGMVPDNDDQETNNLLRRLTDGWGGLFPGGIKLRDIHDLLACYAESLAVEGPSPGGKKCITFATEHVGREHPVIVEIAFGGCSHFVVVVGLVIEDGHPTWMLTVDPNQPASAMCPWNGMIGIPDAGQESTWRRPMGGQQRVRFKGAIALSRKEA